MHLNKHFSYCLFWVLKITIFVIILLFITSLKLMLSDKLDSKPTAKSCHWLRYLIEDNHNYGSNSIVTGNRVIKPSTSPEGSVHWVIWALYIFCRAAKSQYNSLTHHSPARAGNVSQYPKAGITPQLQQRAAGGCHLWPGHSLGAVLGQIGTSHPCWDRQGHPTRGQGGTHGHSWAVNHPAGLVVSAPAAPQAEPCHPCSSSASPGFGWAGIHINNVGGIGITVSLWWIATANKGQIRCCNKKTNRLHEIRQEENKLDGFINHIKELWDIQVWSLLERLMGKCEQYLQTGELDTAKWETFTGLQEIIIFLSLHYLDLAA